LIFASDSAGERRPQIKEGAIASAGWRGSQCENISATRDVLLLLNHTLKIIENLRWNSGSLANL
jgi:hypothetical protein